MTYRSFLQKDPIIDASSTTIPHSVHTTFTRGDAFGSDLELRFIIAYLYDAHLLSGAAAMAVTSGPLQGFPDASRTASNPSPFMFIWV